MAQAKRSKERLIGGCLEVATMIKVALDTHWWSSEEKKQLANETVRLYRLCLRVENVARLAGLLEKLPANKNNVRLAVAALRTVATALIAAGRGDSFFMLIGASASISWCPNTQRCFQLQAYGLIPGYLELVRKHKSPLLFGEIACFRKALTLIFGEAELHTLPFDFSILGFRYWEGEMEKRKRIVEQDFINIEWVIENFNLAVAAAALRTKGIEVALKSLVTDYQIITVANEFSDSRLLCADERLQLVVDKYLGYRRQASNNLIGASLNGLFFQVLQQGLIRARFPIVLGVLDQFYNSSHWRDFHWWSSFEHNPRLLHSLKQGLKLMCYRRRKYDRDLVANLPGTIIRLFGYPNQLDIDEASKLFYQVLAAVYQETECNWLHANDWSELLDDWKLDAWKTLGLNATDATYQKIVDRLHDLNYVDSEVDINFWLMILARSESGRKFLANHPHDSSIIVGNS